MIRTPPRIRKYSANWALVMQNPVSGKQFAWAWAGISGGARAATMETRTKAVSTATRFIALLTQHCAAEAFPRGRHGRRSARVVPPCCLEAARMGRSGPGRTGPGADRTGEGGVWAELHGRPRETQRSESRILRAPDPRAGW